MRKRESLRASTILVVFRILRLEIVAERAHGRLRRGPFGVEEIPLRAGGTGLDAFPMIGAETAEDAPPPFARDERTEQGQGGDDDRDGDFEAGPQSHTGERAGLQRLDGA